MSIDTEATTLHKAVLEFKSTSFSAPVLVIYSSELKQIELQLVEKIAQAPEFFNHSPLLIDLQHCNSQDDAINVTELIKCLRLKNIFPIAISGGNEQQNEQAIKLHIAPHTIRATNPASSSIKAKPAIETTDVQDKNNDQASTETNVAVVENMLISQPIRSGQRIYAKGDLTILSHVSAGAEIMAEGNIHVYGSLRGRALAGVQGNTDSRIFCSDLQAELVSIAGHYKISEEIDKPEDHKPTQIFLQGQSLIIKTL